MNLSITQFVIIITTLTCMADAGTNPTRGPCYEQKNCKECITAFRRCAWCLDPTWPSERCGNLDEISKNCSIGSVYYPRSSILSVQNSPENDGSVSSTKNPIQMKPHKAHLKLRLNDPFPFPVKFAIVENYPLDIYFVFDTSHTMIKYTNMLADLTDRIVSRVARLTSSFKIGFGSFVDKEILPFIRVTENNKTYLPCPECSPGYSFLNHMNLSSDIEAVKKNLLLVRKSGNMDVPEGGFDAIVQAITCKDIIGWRQYSRKMVLLFTDAVSHTGGDGRLAGIVEPNGLKCRLDKNGRYTWSAKEDYPSIAQLESVVEEHRINLIFGVTEDAIDWYREVSQFIPGSSVGKLNDNPDNVIDLVADNFYKIQSSIHLYATTSKDVEVTIRSNCSKGSKIMETSVCHGVKIGDEITFEVVASAKSCTKKTFDVIPVGIAENLRIDIDVDCSCDCGNEEKNSAHCNMNGDVLCGLCQCHAGYYGDKCKCSGDNCIGDEDSCKLSANDTDVCSGRGYCHFGECQCFAINKKKQDEKYSGKFCECSNYNCIRSDGKMCSGKGTCRCGRCECFPSFIGFDCSCSEDTSSCLASNKEICNGKGSCKCGVCSCNPDSHYKGSTCEDCPTCPGMCQELGECALCHSSSKNDFCHNKCRAYNYSTSFSEPPKLNGSMQGIHCRVLGDDNCYIDIVNHHKTRTVFLKKTKDCIRINYLVVFGSVGGGVFIAGIMALIAWKLIVTAYDTKEYRAFENEKKNAKWEENINPLYKEAVSKYTNPTFKSTI